MFQNREDAAHRLAARLKGREFRDPLVLALPRGGVVIGAVLARELGAEFDILLARKLRAPDQPELAIGAVAEDGQVYLDPAVHEFLELPEGYLEMEQRHEMAELARRKQILRALRPQAAIAGRSVIVTDDGIATGSTIMAALNVVRAQKPLELIVAVPVGSPERLTKVRRYCDEVICFLRPAAFWAVGQFYEDFAAVDDKQVVEILREFALPASTRS